MVHILVLDDSKEDRFFIRRVLNKTMQNVALVEFSYADEAMAYLRTPDRPRLDLILVDISIPRMDGFEFADRYAELYPELRGNAPLYIVSSSIDPSDRARAQAHPAVSGFLVKPLSGDVIAEVMAADPLSG